jgi:hypothetical protein
LKHVVFVAWAATLWACGSSSGSPAVAKSVVPTCNDANLCTLSWGAYEFAVDAAHGARIVTFSLAGSNVLLTEAAGDAEFGATFWPSPQTAWGWPPIAAVDTGAYTVSIQGDALVLTSAAFAIAAGDPEMTIEKRFSVDSATNVVTIAYSFDNQGTAAISVAPWEITRVTAGGLTFFPNPASGPVPRTCSGGFRTPTASNDESYTFFVDLPSTGETKLCADGGPKGYEAELLGDLLLVQAWADVPAVGEAPGEGEDELYTDPSFTYEEVENQGPYASLAGGSSAAWTVRWTLTKVAGLPAGVQAPAVLASASLRQSIEQAADSQASLQ